MVAILSPDESLAGGLLCLESLLMLIWQGCIPQYLRIGER